MLLRLYPRTRIAVNHLLQATERAFAEVEPWSDPKRRFRRDVGRALGDRQLRHLDARALVAWAEARAAGGGAWSTSVMLLRNLSAALRDADQLGHDIAQDTRRAPQDAIAILRGRGLVRTHRRRHRRISDDELARVRAAWTSRATSSCLVVLVDTAMRGGELVRLRWQDWDAARGTVLIRDRKHPRRRVGNDQEIPLLRRARGIVDALSIARDTREPRIFPYTQPQLSGGFRRAADRAGFPGHVLHDLRAEGITRLAERGVDILDIQRVSGHRSLKVLATYIEKDPASLHAIWD